VQPPVGEAERNGERVLTVGELTSQIKELLEANFASVWVTGEISNLSRPQSGHYYLTLKDDQAQVRAVVWRSTVNRLRFELEDGLEVICQGQLDVYGPRGTYQLVVRQIEPKGIGALELALRKLRERLAAEGLFDSSRKKPLPGFPRRVAFVTSPTGAAIHDFLQVLRRRWRGTDVLVVPVRVQGEGAGAEIAQAIALVNRLAEPVDCLVVGRGGGSLEDLWAFNEEVVVRAIAASRIPVVSAVGHEIDVTLSDLAADVRALTPSEAAELVVPSTDDMHARLGAFRARLEALVRHRATAAREWLVSLGSRRALRRPLDRIRELVQRLDELDGRSARAAARRLEMSRREVQATTDRLEALSPLAILKRGYSLTERWPEGAVVRSASQVSPGERMMTRLAQGRLLSRVEEVLWDDRMDDERPNTNGG
jgi:exodeoxyribonuclease VII large subunit